MSCKQKIKKSNDRPDEMWSDWGHEHWKNLVHTNLKTFFIVFCFSFFENCFWWIVWQNIHGSNRESFICTGRSLLVRSSWQCFRCFYYKKTLYIRDDRCCDCWEIKQKGKHWNKNDQPETIFSAKFIVDGQFLTKANCFAKVIQQIETYFFNWKNK